MSTLTKSREEAAQTVLIPRVNLLPPEIAEATRLDQMKRIMAASIIGVFVVVILAAVVASFQVSAAQNELADAQDIKMMTKRINGGFIGLEDRIKHYNHAVDILQG